MKSNLPSSTQRDHSTKAGDERLFENGGLIAEAEVVSSFLPCCKVCAVQGLDRSDPTAQEKRGLVGQDVACRSDLAGKRQALAQGTA
jgi:hypothetical protein